MTAEEKRVSELTGEISRIKKHLTNESGRMANKDVHEEILYLGKLLTEKNELTGYDEDAPFLYFDDGEWMREVKRFVGEPAGQEDMLQQVEDTMYAIEDEMTAAGFTGRIREAQVLYILALEDYAEEPDFVSKLVGCFTAEQTDEQLIAAVNAAFGTELTAEEFGEVMGDIRSTAVDTSDWTDKAVKNNLDLVRWAQDAADNGWGYAEGS